MGPLNFDHTADLPRILASCRLKITSAAGQTVQSAPAEQPAGTPSRSPGDRIQSPAGRRLPACSNQMKIELLVDFKEFWSHLRADIERARRSVFVQTFAFEGDRVGKDLAAALLSSPATDKRVLADSFTRVVLNDGVRYWPANLVDSELRTEARETAAMIARVT